MIPDQAVLLLHQLIAKLYLKRFESLIKLLACVSAYNSANAFSIQWLSEKSSCSLKGP